jgi:uncharacterized protein YqjF (DUF2071 family)
VRPDYPQEAYAFQRKGQGAMLLEGVGFCSQRCHLIAVWPLAPEVVMDFYPDEVIPLTLAATDMIALVGTQHVLHIVGK